MIEAADHWIAFGVLGLLGARMLWKSFHPNDEQAPALKPTWPVVLATLRGQASMRPQSA